MNTLLTHWWNYAETFKSKRSNFPVKTFRSKVSLPGRSSERSAILCQCSQRIPKSYSPVYVGLLTSASWRRSASHERYKCDYKCSVATLSLPASGRASHGNRLSLSFERSRNDPTLDWNNLYYLKTYKFCQAEAAPVWPAAEREPNYSAVSNVLIQHCFARHPLVADSGRFWFDRTNGVRPAHHAIRSSLNPR